MSHGARADVRAFFPSTSIEAAETALDAEHPEIGADLRAVMGSLLRADIIHIATPVAGACLGARKTRERHRLRDAKTPAYRSVWMRGGGNLSAYYVSFAMERRHVAAARSNTVAFNRSGGTKPAEPPSAP
jgi:hypothetical protein